MRLLRCTHKTGGRYCMAYTRQQLLDRILRSYESSYDIERIAEDQPLEGAEEVVAKAHFHVEDTAYMISKKATMWQTESDEYVWFVSVGHLTEEIAARSIEYVRVHGLELIDLSGHRNHMCTRLAAVFLCDSADEAALEKVRKCRIYKSFQFSLKGWMEVHTAVAEVGKESVVSNSYGRLTAKHLKNLMRSDLKPETKKNPILAAVSMVKKMLD